MRATASGIEAVTTGGAARYLTELKLDGSGRISTLVFRSIPTPPHTWAALDAQLRSLAPAVSFSTDRIAADGTCTPVHTLDGTRPRPLGSAFKLYVLGALARAVAHHTAAWDEQLAVHERWKSLPSGVLQDRAAGTDLSLRRYADLMISISDNTAADHLIHRLGRRSVQRQLTRFGNAHPRSTTPFPTTRELFTLKGYHYPALADAYLAVPRLLRPVVLALTAAVPLSSLSLPATPSKIDRIEWFGSPDDVCRAFAGLWSQAHTTGLAPVGQALSLNDGGLALDPARYPTVWFKGGSEPGVLTVSYLVRSAGGGLLVASVMLENPTKALDEATLAPRALSVVRGALALATGDR